MVKSSFSVIWLNLCTSLSSSLSGGQAQHPWGGMKKSLPLFLPPFINLSGLPRKGSFLQTSAAAVTLCQKKKKTIPQLSSSSLHSGQNATGARSWNKCSLKMMWERQVEAGKCRKEHVWGWLTVSGNTRCWEIRAHQLSVRVEADHHFVSYCRPPSLAAIIPGAHTLTHTPEPSWQIYVLSAHW